MRTDFVLDALEQALYARQAFAPVKSDFFIMCGGIEYQGHKIFFPNPEARLPVRTRDGNVSWVPWGSCDKVGRLTFPNGGWARLDSIKAGKWKPWHPRPVLIPAESFMEKDQDKQSHWISLAHGMAIQALLAERDGEQRVYVVTEETPSEYHWIHDRWPRLRRLSDNPMIIGH